MSYLVEVHKMQNLRYLDPLHNIVLCMILVMHFTTKR